MFGSPDRKRWEFASRLEIPGRVAGRRDIPEIGCHEGCCDAVTREHLVPYAFGTCDEDASLSFEAHLLDCDACYEDLKVLDRARELVQGWTMPQRSAVRRLRIDGL